MTYELISLHLISLHLRSLAKKIQVYKSLGAHTNFDVKFHKFSNVVLSDVSIRCLVWFMVDCRNNFVASRYT